jgi:hypothetical protein
LGEESGLVPVISSVVDCCWILKGVYASANLESEKGIEVLKEI